MNDKTTPDLATLPCPFCGTSGAVHVSRPDTRQLGENQSSIMCQLAGCAARTGWFDVSIDALDAWNRRPLVSKTTKQEDSPQFVAYRSPDGDLLGECGEGEAPATPPTEAALSFEAWWEHTLKHNDSSQRFSAKAAWHAATAARDSEIAALRDALKGITEHYCGLVNSGDAGHWNPEEDQEVIAARLALNQKPLP